ncbi:hypothetical protein, partial [Marivita sp.]|uniref:hypothetical protein n=1 Tax=Marivita sp. TaxID=2003365 RepID=UPI0025BC0C5E
VLAVDAVEVVQVNETIRVVVHSVAAFRRTLGVVLGVDAVEVIQIDKTVVVIVQTVLAFGQGNRRVHGGKADRNNEQPAKPAEHVPVRQENGRNVG